MNDIVKVETEKVVLFETEVGKENPLRGLHHADDAAAFVGEFPIGSELSPDDFDKWAHRTGRLNVPFGAPKNADVWKAHLQRRHELRYRINKAATHTRMYDRGLAAFTIEATSPGVWTVVASHIALTRNKLPAKVQSIIARTKKRLAYLKQSSDYASLPVEARVMIENIWDEIESFGAETDYKADNVKRRVGRLESNLRKLSDSGNLQTKNGGVKAFLENKASDD
jgi:hypothetical protein